MAISELQFPGWRLHKRRGEALQYYNGIASSSLVTQYTGATSPSINIAPILPAGTFININGQLYITRNNMTSGQWGEMDPLNWHPTYIMPKAAVTIGTATSDRVSLYWDATACCATTTVSTNKFIGYSVPNMDLATGTLFTAGQATLATGTLTVSSFNGQTVAYSVTGGTTADGKLRAYATTDLFVEVEVVVSNSISVGGMYGPLIAGYNAAGNNIANGTALTYAAYYNVAGGNNAAGVVLTSGVAAKVRNAAASSVGLMVYPPAGGTINALSANSALNLNGLLVAEFVPTAANGLVFYTNPVTPS